MERYSAIYVRQSVDKADSISIESQIEFCKYELRGESYKVFSDKGFSGKNTERPQFREMIKLIKNGEISRVIVYKLDRISRSILDFSNMLAQFQDNGVEFLSCSEKFDTASPMGRAMLNVCVVFAQLERETIQQRVYDAYLSRSRKGFYMGGRIPYGFKLKPYIIDGKRTSCYEAFFPEAETVKLIFSMYSDRETSFGDISRRLKELKIINPNTKDGSWDRARISRMVRNPIYIRADLEAYRFFKAQGAILHNPPEDFIGIHGCYLYNERGAGDKKTTLNGQSIVLAPHEGIVDSDTWIKAMTKCMGNKAISKHYKAKNSWLSGKVRCGKCGYSMAVKKAKNQSDMYFICSRHLQLQQCEGVGGVISSGLEKYIMSRIQEKLKLFDGLLLQSKHIENPCIKELEIKVEQIQYEIDSMVYKAALAEGALFKYINEKVSCLHREKKEVEEKILKAKAGINEMETFTAYKYCDKLQELSFEGKTEVLNLLIDKILVYDDEIKIDWKI